MERPMKILKDQKGAVLMVSAIVLLAVMVMGIGMLTNNQLKSRMAHNRKERLKSFYAADGLMTKLAQEIIMDRGAKYTRNPGFKGVDLVTATYEGGDTLIGNNQIIWAAGSNGIGGLSDECHFQYVKLEGDFDISVEITDVQDSIGTSAAPDAGVMVRNSLTSDAPAIFWGYSGGGGALKVRTTTGGATNDTTDSQIGLGVDYRLKRDRDRFLVYVDEGNGWRTVADYDDKNHDAFNKTLYVGVAVSANAGGALVKATMAEPRGFAAVDTTTVGEYDVRSSITHTPSGYYEITTEAFKLDNSNEAAFSTSLGQMVAPEIGAGWKSEAEDIMMVPVTYYDFRADGSNPEFQVSGLEGVFLHNMVQSTLDDDRKPKPIHDDPLASATFRDCMKANCVDAATGTWLHDWHPNRCCLNSAYFVSDMDNWWDDQCLNVLFGSGWQGCMDRVPEDEENWFFSDNIDKWFRPNGATADVEFDILTGRWSGLEWVNAFKGYVGKNQADADPFANVVIYDKLAFKRGTKIAGSGITDDDIFTLGLECDENYWAFCGADQTLPGGHTDNWERMFHPIANRGFGYDGPCSYYSGGECYHKASWGSTADPFSVWGDMQNQNMSFTMEMHQKFVHEAGQFFSFRGNDDLFVFVDGKLAMDIGGVHNAVELTLDLDTLGLTVDQEYWFDLFLAERNGWGSEVLIETNIMWYDPGRETQRRWKRDYGTLD